MSQNEINRLRIQPVPPQKLFINRPLMARYFHLFLSRQLLMLIQPSKPREQVSNLAFGQRPPLRSVKK
jgi:hypothetical protein